MNDVTKEIIQYRIETLTKQMVDRERSIRSEQEMIDEWIEGVKETKRIIAQLEEDLEPHLPQGLPKITTILRDRF